MAIVSDQLTPEYGIKAYPFAKLLQDVDLNQCLLMEPFLVTNDLDCNKSTGLVIYAAHNLSKTTLAEEIYNLVAIGQVVSKDYVVVTAIVIVSEVSRGSIQVSHVLLCALGATKIYLFVIYDFASFEDVQAHHLKCLRSSDTFLWASSLPKLIYIAGCVFEVFAFGGKFFHFLISHQVVSIEVGIKVARS